MNNVTDTEFNLRPISSKLGARRAVRSYSRFGIAVTLYLTVANLLAAFMSSELSFEILRVFFGIEAAHKLFDSVYYFWIIQVVCMYLIGYPVFRIFLIGVPTKREKKSKMSLAELTVAFLICMAGVQIGAYIGNVVNTVVSIFTGYIPEDTTSALITASPIWLVVLVVVIIGPIIEELIFRRVFIDKLSRFGERLAIVVSAVAFGLFHGNFNQFFFATIIGLVLGYVYTRTRKLRYTAILHMLINFVGTVPVLALSDAMAVIEELAYIESELTAEQSLALISASFSLFGYLLLQWTLAIIGIVMFIIVVAKKRITFTPKNKFVLRPIDVPRVAIFNLGSILFIAFSAFMFLLSVFPVGGLY